MITLSVRTIYFNRTYTSRLTAIQSVVCWFTTPRAASKNILVFTLSLSPRKAMTHQLVASMPSNIPLSSRPKHELNCRSRLLIVRESRKHERLSICKEVMMTNETHTSGVIWNTLRLG